MFSQLQLLEYCLSIIFEFLVFPYLKIKRIMEINVKGRQQLLHL